MQGACSSLFGVIDHYYIKTANYEQKYLDVKKEKIQYINFFISIFNICFLV